MFQYPANHRLFLDERTYPHGAAAFGAGQRVCLVYLLNQTHPVGTALFAVSGIRLLVDNLRCLTIVHPKLPAPATGGIAVPAIVPHHLLTMPGDMADDHGQPVEGAEAFGRVAILGAIDDRAALFMVRHPLVRELATNDVMGKTLQHLPVIRRYRLADMDVEAAVTPRHEQVDVPLCDGPLLQQHLQDLMPKELFQGMGVVVRGDAEVPLFVEGAIGDDDVAVGVEAEEVSEGLNGAGAAGHGVAWTCHVLFQRLPSEPA